MSIASLPERLRNLPEKRYRTNEMYSIIHDFLLAPMIAKLIEDNNRIYKVKRCFNENYYTIALKLLYERDRHTGLFAWLKRTLCPFTCGVKITHNGQLFVCEYYKHTFFSFCDKVKEDYDNKLKYGFSCDFVVVARV